MARITVAQLTAQLEASHVAYERLATEHAALKAELAARTTQRVRPTPVVNSAYREACAKARALAMSTGKCVSVAARS